MPNLPKLAYQELAPTRDYLRDVALVLGSVQRAFIAPLPHQWEHGLQVNMRGISTKEFVINGQPTRASIDFVKHKVRIGGNKWSLTEYAAPEILNNIRLWLESQNVSTELELPTFSGATQCDETQSSTYAEALWWIDVEFQKIARQTVAGKFSPLLLYPHHFDLSLAYFPFDDDKQIAIGFSTGDETIAEPYLYLTAYPETGAFRQLALPPTAYRQTNGFNGAVLTYDNLRKDSDPKKLLSEFASAFTIGADLF